MRQTERGYAWFWFDRGEWKEVGCLGTFERIIDGRRYLVDTFKKYFCITFRKNPPQAASQDIKITLPPHLVWRLKTTAQMLNITVSELLQQIYISWSSPGEFRTLDRERILEAFEERRNRLML